MFLRKPSRALLPQVAAAGIIGGFAASWNHQRVPARAEGATAAAASSRSSPSSTTIISTRQSGTRIDNDNRDVHPQKGKKDAKFNSSGESSAPASSPPEGEQRVETTTSAASVEADASSSTTSTIKGQGRALYEDMEIEEDPSCPLCRFMRSSPCGQTWLSWEKCVAYYKQKDEDFVGPCANLTLVLAHCIQEHKEDFPAVLRRKLGMEGLDEEEGDDDEEESGKH